MAHSTASLLDAFLANHGGHGDPFPGPFGSPLEERFADALRPHLAQAVRVEQQRVHYTAIGRFVLDFCFTTPAGFCVAVECDGVAFHDRESDEWRDAALISERKVDLMVRIDGRFLNAVPADVLYLLSTIAPDLVSPRGRQNIVKLSTVAARRYDRRTPGIVWVEYPELDALRAAEDARWRNADDPDAWEADDPWYTEQNLRAETGPKIGYLYVSYAGRGVPGADQGWRDRARIIAANPGATLRDLLGLPATGAIADDPDPIGDAFQRAWDEAEATIPPELSWFLLPAEAPPEQPYGPSPEWRARVAMLDGTNGIAQSRDAAEEGDGEARQ